MWTGGPFVRVLESCLTGVGPRLTCEFLWTLGELLLDHCWTVLDSWVISSLGLQLEFFVSLPCSEGLEWVVSLAISAGFIGWKLELVGNREKWKIHPVQLTLRANSPPLGTRDPHGSPGLHPRYRRGGPPRRLTATPPTHHCHRPRERLVGSPLHGALLGPRVPQRSRHTGTHGGLGYAGKGYEELPPLPPRRRQPTRITMADGPPRNSTETCQPHTKPREGDHENTGGTPGAGPRPAGYTPLPPSPRPSGPNTSSPAEASREEKGHSRS